MNLKKVVVSGVIAAAAVMGTLYAANQSKVTIKGSDTMVILTQRWAEVFMKKNPSISIQLTGGGSGTGIAALLNGTTDICNASREMKDQEIANFKEKHDNASPVQIKCARDGISLYVNESNPVKVLTLAQLKDIYTGVTTNWKDVGGEDAKIVTYGRENSSGTYDFFKEHVLKNADFSTGVQSLPGTAAIVNAVKEDKNGIGYGGAAYAKGIDVLKVKRDASSEAIEATEANIKTGTYPISRFLYMYVAKKPEGDIKKFVDWTLSAEGQKIITEVGYFPLK